VSVESQGRLLRGVWRAVGRTGEKTKPNMFAKGFPQNLTAAFAQLDREVPAMRTLVAFALELAGTDKLLPPEPPPPPPVTPVGLGNAPMHVPEPPPRLRRPTQDRVWTKDIRPGPHDVLTWEEAMRVPWFDPLAETER
jgi:hypothetical protein